MNNFFITDRFFYLVGVIIFLFVLSFFVTKLFVLAALLLLILIVALVYDTWFLFQIQEIEAKRELSNIMSLGDYNKVLIELSNKQEKSIYTQLYDEVPYPFNGNYIFYKYLKGRSDERIEYTLKPNKRGEYFFGNLVLFISSSLHLVQKRMLFSCEQKISVYPSIMQMHEFHFKLLSRNESYIGGNKIRKIGHGYEFGHIADYVKGDDYRSINWKASGRKANLMVNKYEDEKSQQFYVIIDKSRIMNLSFGGMNLLDYSINTSLVLANIVLKKGDKVGLISFSNVVGTIIKAGIQKGQLHKITEALFREKYRNTEGNYKLLYLTIKKLIRRRSLLFLFTNIESNQSLKRKLPILKLINKFNYLVVVLFQNPEVSEYAISTPHTVKEIFTKTMAKKHIMDKSKYVSELRKNGIQVILTEPENLSTSTLNKYLELKSKRIV